MGDIDADSEQSGPGARTRVRFRCPVRCMEMIGLLLELGSASDVRMWAKFSFRDMVRYG